MSDTMADSTDALHITACTGCGFRSLTPVSTCPACGAAVEDRAISPVGTVWSQTLVHLPFGDLTVGYRLVYVDIDDGPRILCRQMVDATSPADISDRVTVAAADTGFTLSEVAE
ncbi:OB-fold domain-containing protein [Corynebacterium glyciniphilum]|uniref:OB-fold domain-containing protein n=1 Tax=Corynebacterium glyciniphilum TaxID=1404244 RepID=UPI002352D853